MPGRFITSTSTFDAIDFTAGALIAGLREPVHVLVDLTDKRTDNPTLDNFDPRHAFTLPFHYGVSPDGNLRQMVLSIPRLLKISSQHPVRLKPLNTLLDITDGLNEVLRVTAGFCDVGNSPEVSFIKACYTKLGLRTVAVSERRQRALQNIERQRVLELLRTSLRTKTTSHLFRQGGFVSVDGQQYRSSYLDKTGQLILVASNGHELSGVASLSSKTFELGGPLDALSCEGAGSHTHGHIPWYLDSEEALENGPKGVEIALSLFLKFPESRPRRLRQVISGTLIDEYPGEGIGAYKRIVSSRFPWIFDTARWIADNFGPSEERWAWSQTGTRRFVQALREGKLKPPSANLLYDLVMFGLKCDHFAKGLYLSDAQYAADTPETSALVAEFRSLFDICCSLMDASSFPLTYANSSKESLHSIAQKFDKLRLVGSTASTTLKEVRYFAWEVVKVITGAILLLADTSLRASLPLLASLMTAVDLQTFIGYHKAEIASRLAHPMTIKCV